MLSWPPTTTASTQPLARAWLRAYATSGMPPTVISGLGTPFAALPSREPLPAARMTVCETDSEEGIRCILPYGPYGASRRVRVTFPGLAHTSDPERLWGAPGRSAAPSPDRV